VVEARDYHQCETQSIVCERGSLGKRDHIGKDRKAGSKLSKDPARYFQGPAKQPDETASKAAPTNSNTVKSACLRIPVLLVTD
jgi:hypothetical protein